MRCSIAEFFLSGVSVSKSTVGSPFLYPRCTATGTCNSSPSLAAFPPSQQATKKNETKRTDGKFVNFCPTAEA